MTLACDYEGNYYSAIYMCTRILLSCPRSSIKYFACHYIIVISPFYRLTDCCFTFLFVYKIQNLDFNYIPCLKIMSTKY